MLLHLHGIGPVRLALEDEDLEVFGVRSDELVSHWLLYVDVFLVLLL